MPNELCKLLPWDTEFFGRRIARYCGEALTEQSAAAALVWCRREKVECLYVLVGGDATELAIARRLGFVEADTRVTLLLDNPTAAVAHVRDAQPADVPVLRSIARSGHHDGRFYHDPHFPASICDAFYETWIERSCGGWADRVLVTPESGSPAGYVTCHVAPDGDGSIGLIAVGEDHRRNGYGGALIGGALAYFHERGARKVRVVTQGRNEQGKRLYERHGFQVESTGIYFHAWPEDVQ